ncbi:MAG: hypothetical protein M0C28_37740 [Candidatus Moduliflexus flocculans]|nr:hypothetical protein [Candidatus Moduliflexus flocculans]
MDGYRLALCALLGSRRRRRRLPENRPHGPLRRPGPGRSPGPDLRRRRLYPGGRQIRGAAPLRPGTRKSRHDARRRDRGSRGPPGLRHLQHGQAGRPRGLDLLRGA